MKERYTFITKLGISVYPEHSAAERDQAYIRKVESLEYKRIFACLLSVGSKSGEQVASELHLLTDTAHECSMEATPDISPMISSKMRISYEDLSVSQDMHVDGVHLDEGFDGMKESLMIYNPQGLKVELGTGTQLVYVENVMDHHPDRSRLVTCHNFYPQQYSELSLEHFNKCNERVKPTYFPAAAFISNDNEGTYGPWSVNEGLCTLEIHRGLPIGFQTYHLFTTGVVDDVLIADTYASAEELEACAAVNPSTLTFELILEKELTRTEQKILNYKPEHVIHGGTSEYIVRSTQSRVTFADKSIPAANTRDLKRGSMVVFDDDYLKYKGELYIVLEDMPNDGHRNVIDHLPEYEYVLLNCVEPWKVFVLCKAWQEKQVRG